MKEPVNLQTRHEHIFKTSIPCTKTVTEDGYTLVFILNQLPDLTKMDYVHKRLYLKDHSDTEAGFVIKYNGPKDITCAEYEKKYKCVGHNIFKNKTWVQVIRYDGKKIIMKKGATMYYSFQKIFFEYFGLECIPNEFDTDHSERAYLLLNNKTVLKGIYTQKITNLKDALATYMSSSFKVKTFNYQQLKKYIQRDGTQFLTQFREFTTSFDNAVNFALKYDYWSNEGQIFRDLLKDAEILDQMINPNWSYKRMLEEHAKFTDIQMQYKSETMDKSPIYDIDPVIDQKIIKGHILNNELDTFREGSHMRHCIYTNYFKRIQRGDYIGLSLTKPERCTVGLSFNTGTRHFQLEQIRTYRNGTVSEETDKIINLFITQNQKFFDALRDEKKESVLIKSCMAQVHGFTPDEDMPF